MDCVKLQSDIKELESLRDSLVSNFDYINENGKGLIKARANQKQAHALEDKLLQDYLQDFAEKNPDLFSWHLGEEIEGFNEGIWSIASLTDGNALVGGINNELRICSQDPSGSWQLSEKIKGFNSYSYITSIAPLPDGNALVGGDFGELRICSKDSDGNWKLGEKINGFNNCINSIAPLPDGSALVGDVHELRICSKDPNGNWQLSEKIPSSSKEIRSISPLPDGSALVGGWNGELRICSKDSNDNWKLGEKIEGFNGRILSVAPLPDGSALVGGGGVGEGLPGIDDDGELRICSQSPDGNWQLGEEIKGFNSYITSIATLTDGSALVGGYEGELRLLSKLPLTIDTLKRNLAKLSGEED